jgi:proline dehydrogenase
MSILYFFAKRFLAGETLEQALPVLARLKNEGFATTVDYLGEHVTHQEAARRATDAYLKIIKSLKEKKLDRNISVKLTQIGLDMDTELCLENLKRIGLYARERNFFVRVDAEGSGTISAGYDMIKTARDEGLPVGATVQSMLRHTPVDMVTLLEKEIHLRLCKGAYKEPIDVAFQDKKDINRQFVSLMKRLLTSGIYHGIATHDEKIIAETIKFVQEHALRADQFEFQLLYGIRSGLARKLLNEGWRVRIYAPFGCAWLPYFYRRLRERKENVWFVIKNLFRN